MIRRKKPATSGVLCRSVADALGFSFETTREHLRNIRRADMITFKGYGRGAALMTTLDAARLVLAAAGSTHAKDSLETLIGFGKLQPVGGGQPLPGRSNRELRPAFELETYLALMMQRLIDLKGRLPVSYQRPPHPDPQARVFAMTLVSVAGSNAADFPRFAFVRYWGESVKGLAGGLSFASPGWREPFGESAHSALATGPKPVGIVQERHVTGWAIAEIAHSLVP